MGPGLEGEALPPFVVGGPGGLPPIPRVWFVSDDQTWVIQVQRDRFVYNWRSQSADAKYPRFPKILNSFEKCLAVFKRFLDEIGAGQLVPVQYELTYVNHVLQGQGWHSLADIGDVFPDFGWRSRVARFLGEPEGVNWQTQFLLPQRAGRLHMTALAREIQLASSRVEILLS